MDLSTVLDGTVSTLVGGALGGLLRLAPEVLTILDKGNERKHELAMLDKNIAAEEARAKSGLIEKQVAADSAQVTAGLAALQDAIKGQAAQTGIKWVDAVNATVRPFLTYGIAGPYSIGKLFVFGALMWGAVRAGLTPAEVQSALQATYSAADMAILAGVINFWFLGRVFDKRS